MPANHRPASDKAQERAAWAQVSAPEARLDDSQGKNAKEQATHERIRGKHSGTHLGVSQGIKTDVRENIPEPEQPRFPKEGQ
jgi:hypothetical protein